MGVERMTKEWKPGEFVERTAELFEEERIQPLTWWYLSFADKVGFRGAAIVEARGLLGAIARCNVLQINPHGEVRGIQLVETLPERYLKMTDRLLTRADLEAMDGGAIKWK